MLTLWATALEKNYHTHTMCVFDGKKVILTTNQQMITRLGQARISWICSVHNNMSITVQSNISLLWRVWPLNSDFVLICMSRHGCCVVIRTCFVQKASKSTNVTAKTNELPLKFVLSYTFLDIFRDILECLHSIKHFKLSNTGYYVSVSTKLYMLCWLYLLPHNRLCHCMSQRAVAVVDVTSFSLHYHIILAWMTATYWRSR